jgi:hypothetical protein
MPIRGEIVRAGGILLMMVRGVYWVVDDRWLTLELATLPKTSSDHRSVLTTEGVDTFGARRVSRE